MFLSCNECFEYLCEKTKNQHTHNHKYLVYTNGDTKIQTKILQTNTEYLKKTKKCFGISINS